MNYKQLFLDTEQFVIDLYDNSEKEGLIYHNLEHVKYVAKRATEIAAHYELSDEDTFIIFISAWFHDVGYLSGPAQGHEDRSIASMKEFAQMHDIPNYVIDKVEACISATKVCIEPASLLEQILVDADSYNLGTKRFKVSNESVFQEFNATGNSVAELEFTKNALNMMEKHSFRTKYAQELLFDSKQKNMKKLKSKISKLEKEDKVEKADKAESVDETKDVVITEKHGTTKGMQTMLRLTSQNHVQLSEMADAKANILISVNAIIISVILSVLLRKLTEDPYLTIPTLIFLVSSVTTIVLAIMATRPKVNTGRFSQEDIDNKKTNLLFFGNFHKMDYETYSDAMRTMMTDADYLYGSMLQDIFVLGTVLGRKYKLLRLAYTLFMVGIIVSVLAFAIASIASGAAPVEVGAPAGKSSGSPF